MDLLPQTALSAAIFKDQRLTPVMGKADADRAQLEYSYLAARITLRVNPAVEEIGLTAAVSRVPADAGISCNVTADAGHDHLFADWPGDIARSTRSVSCEPTANGVPPGASSCQTCAVRTARHRARGPPVGHVRICR